MKTKLSFIIVAAFAFLACAKFEVSPTTIKKVELSAIVDSSAKNILIISAGQSNMGHYTLSQLPLAVHNPRLHFWNVTTQKIDTVMSASNTWTATIGTMPYVVQKMLTKFPNAQLYFCDVHQGSTGMNKWSIDPGYNSLYVKLCQNVDKFMTLIPAPDQVEFVWAQGEGDTGTPQWDTTYLKHETDLFNALKNKYHPETFHNFQIDPFLYGTSKTYAAKFTHASQDSTINLYLFPKARFGGLYHNDWQHLNIQDGIQAFADSIVTHVN